MAPAEMAKILDITIEEAKAVIATDAEIDRGANPFPLTAEQQKVEKAMRGTGTRVTESKKKGQTVYSFTKRTRKPNDGKRLIIQSLLETVQSLADESEVTNAERQIVFKIGEKKYELTLVEKRK